MTTKFPCPSCGHLVFDEATGSDGICPVCLWQDDLFGLLTPFEAIGPNKVSLFDAQVNVLAHGVSHLDCLERRQKPKLSYQRDLGWRPIDKRADRFLDDSTYPPDETKVYYWRDDYWLASKS
jgi:hypothetical protein